MSKIQTKQFLDTRPIPMPESTKVQEVLIAITMPAAAAAPAIGDLVELFKLPIGVRCVDFTVLPSKADTNGTPTLVASIGIENTAGTDIGTEVWQTGITFAGATTRCTNAFVLVNGDTTTDRNVVLKWTAAAATYAPGVLVFILVKLHG